MKVEKRINLGNGHSIEFGKATWNEDSISIRNRYPTSTGGFSPRSSSEIPIEDVKIIVEQSISNGYIDDYQLIEIAELCIKKLKAESSAKDFLTNKAEKMAFMKGAASDPLFLEDLKETMEDYKAIDSENI